MNRVCERCGVSIESKPREQKFCSLSCSSTRHDGCSVEGCDKPHIARGLCRLHWKRQYGKPARKVEIPCDTCGTLIAKEPTGRFTKRFCSLRCRDFWRHLERGGQLSCPVPDAHPSRSTRIPVDHPVRRDEKLNGQRCAVFITDCVVCKATFATPYTVSTCSKRCAAVKARADKNEAKLRRRARQRNAYVAPVNRHMIYERDEWVCHLCHKKVDRNRVVPHPKAPTLDHVIPLARGGTHEPANVKTAHFLCNCLKSDGGGNEQLLLIG